MLHLEKVKKKKKIRRLDGKLKFNPHMHKIFSQIYCMKRVPGDTQKEMLNELDKMTFLSHKSNSCTV